MNKEEFVKEIILKLKEINININEKIADKFYKYTNMLLEWNEKINLTAITEISDIILKHYIDSLTINKYIKEQNTIIDIGTGAGFPGIPLKILNNNIEFILVDSLNKRINFLGEVKEKLSLAKLKNIHARVEDLAQNKEYREKVNLAVSRAVASLRILAEYMLPFVEKDGYCICMKGPNINEEIKEGENAIDILGGKIEKIESLLLPEKIEGNIVIIKKIKNTPPKYPRKAGMPSKQPL